MKQPDFTGIVTAQYTGKQIEAKETTEMKDESEAKIFYETVKDRLLK